MPLASAAAIAWSAIGSAQPASVLAEAPPAARRGERAAEAAGASPVVLRGPTEIEKPRANLDFAESISLTGVRTVGGQWLSLDRVKSVGGPLAAAWRDVEPTAELAWRARIRLERGDLIAAEPLFEQLYSTYADADGPTAAVIAEGALRCRLRRGVVAGSVAPWLTLLRVADAGVAARSVDSQTQLLPGVPPIWLNIPATQALARAALRSGAGDAVELPGLLAALYQSAARFECGMEASVPSPVAAAIAASSDEGVQLVALIVRSRAGEPAERRESRIGLNEWLKRRPPQWQESWIRCGIGRSLLLESTDEERLLGVAALLAIPATIDRVNPYLTGVSLAEAAVAVARDGDPATAVLLRDELAVKFPNHPALDWEPLRSVRLSGGVPDRPTPPGDTTETFGLPAGAGAPGARER